VKKLVCLLVVVSFLITGCATSGGAGSDPSVSALIPRTMRAVCGLYSTIKPQYPAIKAYVVANREEIEKRVPGIWEALVTVDRYAVELDAGLSVICSPAGNANAHVSTAAQRPEVPWDAIGSAVVKIATVGLQVYANRQ
jgi:predicted small secreted protein